MLPRMNRTVPAALILAATALLTTACASTGSTNTPAVASTAACIAAFDHEMKQLEANPSGPSMGKPAACNGLSDATLNDIAKQEMAKMWGDMASATALPTDLMPSDFPTSYPTDFPTDLPTWPTDLATP